MFIVSLLLLSACTPTVFTAYHTATLSEQPIIPKSLEFDLSSADYYFYEKFLADKLTLKLKEQGWSVKESNADYKLILRYGIYERLHTAIDSTPIWRIFIKQRNPYFVPGRFFEYALVDKKTGKPRIYGSVRTGTRSIDDMMLLNHSVGIIAEEMKTTNAIQQKKWECIVEIHGRKQYEYKNPKCSMEDYNKYQIKYPHKLDVIKSMDFFTPIIEKKQKEQKI